MIVEAEINALLDSHDALIRACIDSALAFSAFVSAYGVFPRNYSFGGESNTAEEAVASKLFRKRIAFHTRVAGVLSGLRSADDASDIPYEDAGRFLPSVGLKRLQELVARYPDFTAEPDLRAES